ncbi:MAG: CRISPR-associated endonuclease Cas2 [bacterium JZ-2024 1]
MQKRHIVISYDIPDDERRNELHSLLLAYGVPVQFSVFECELKEEEILKLLHRMERILNREEDSVILYFLCEHCIQNIQRLGVKKNIIPDDIIIV